MEVSVACRLWHDTLCGACVHQQLSLDYSIVCRDLVLGGLSVTVT